MADTLAKMAAGIVAGAFLLGGVACSTSFTVDERERAVVTRNGAFSYVADPGRHYKMPLIDDYVIFNVGLQSFTIDKAEAFTSDNQPLYVDMVVQYSVPFTSVERIYREVKDYEARLRTMANDRMKAIFGGLNVSDVPRQRAQIARQVHAIVREEAQRLFGLNVTDVQLVNIEYSPAFSKAVGDAAVAKAEVERAEQARRRAEVEAQSVRIAAEGQANAAIEAARGAAESRRLQAIAEADATRVQGEAQADAIRAQSEALGSNPNLIQLEQARRWNGQLPTQMLGSTPLPFVNLNQR